MEPKRKKEEELEEFKKKQEKIDKKNAKIKKKICKELPECVIDYINGEANHKYDKLGFTNENVSDFLPLKESASEYKGNAEIRNTIMRLSYEKPLFRKIRGDGNCFFRAIVVKYFEKLLEDDIPLDKAKIAKSKVIKFIKEVLKGELIQCKTQDSNDLNVYLEDIKSMKYILSKNVCDILYQKFFLIEQYEDEAIAYQKLLDVIQIKLNQITCFDISLVVFLRYWILHSYKEHFNEYQNFIYDDTAENILKTYGLEAENVIIPLAADALQCNVVINMIHTDYKMNKTILKVDKYEGLLERKINADFDLNMYFRPGHYEVLYDRNFYEKYYKNDQKYRDL